MRLILAILSFSVGVFFVNSPVAAQVTPSLLIVSPSPGEVVAGSTVAVEVRIPDGFTLVFPDEHTEYIEGEGHLHIWLDPVRSRARDGVASPAGTAGTATSNGMDARPNHADETSVVIIDKTAYVYENVFSGLHTIYAELYRNDHLSYEPRLFDQVEFETYRESLVPRDENGDEAGAPPVSSGGLFLPPEGGNTVLVIFIVGIAVAVLWHLFGRARKDKI